MNPLVEVPKAQWPQYFDAVTREMENADLAIEVSSDGWPPMIEADRLVLQFLAYDGRDELFEVAGEVGSTRVCDVFRRLVERPRRVSADASTLTPSRIEVEGRDGSRIVIKLARDDSRR